MKQTDINKVADFCKGFPFLKNFSAKEFLYLGGSGDGRNSLPLRKYWTNLYNLARYAQEVRDEFGSALQTTSVYRSPFYNAYIGGATKSQHLRGRAVDLVPVNGNVKALQAAAKKVRARGRFKGGIGIYSTFVHIDTRGHNVGWDNS